jgi:hypothetical protein
MKHDFMKHYYWILYILLYAILVVTGMTIFAAALSYPTNNWFIKTFGIIIAIAFIEFSYRIRRKSDKLDKKLSKS